jgi:hypothetical protein
MIHDHDNHDPLLQSLRDTLRPVTPSHTFDRRVRARCHAALISGNSHGARRWSPARAIGSALALAFLCAYLTAVFETAARLTPPGATSSSPNTQR